MERTRREDPDAAYRRVVDFSRRVAARTPEATFGEARTGDPDWLDRWRDDPREEQLCGVDRWALSSARALRRAWLVGERDDAVCGAPIGTGKWTGLPCPEAAGRQTDHPGYGRCWRHRGNSHAGRAEGAWLMAHRFAQELDITPWDALLKTVRIAAGKVAYCEWVLSQASNDLELEGRFGRSDDDNGILLHPDTGEPLGAGQLRNLKWWVEKSELWVDRLARYSKAAVDAGVAAVLVQQVELQGAAIARVLNAMLQRAEEDGMSEVLLAELRATARRELLAIESEGGRIRPSTDPDAAVVDSTWTSE